MPTFLDALVEALQQAAAYNHNDQVAPAAVLWTDGAREWEALLPSLRERLPALLTFGAYAPDQRTGPAYWLRCVLAGTLPECALPADGTPIIYLPGVSRQDLRTGGVGQREIQPLIELQYRGALWTQRNGKDWTPAAYLQSKDGGLGFEVAADQATRQALRRALPLTAKQSIDTLMTALPLKADFFDDLLHPDEVRSLLRWLDNPQEFQALCTDAEWAAFCDLCRRQYQFDPVADGALSAARKLGEDGGAWKVPWQRLAEAPASYMGIVPKLRAAGPQPSDHGRKPRQPSLLDRSEVWPQVNEAKEAALRDALDTLAQQHPHEARQTIANLEMQHGERRGWIWAKLGWAPLATALQALSSLAMQTKQPLGGANTSEIVDAYVGGAWQADAAVLDALAAVEQPGDVHAVTTAIRAVYADWLDAAARAMQRAVAVLPPDSVAPIACEPGTCLLFSDGLRYDVGTQVQASVIERGLTCELGWRFAALPTVTATAKPALAPLGVTLGPGGDFDAAVTPGGARVTASVLHRLLGDAGIQVLRGDETGDPTGRSWTELGDIDAYCHEHGWKVAKQVPSEVRTLVARIGELLDAGWEKVVVVTDHGWILLPEGLPKVELPEHLTEIRKGRCARLKPTAQTDMQSVHWQWDATVQIAVAPGSACFEAGREAEHGGISPQECIVPVLMVSGGHPATGTTVHIEDVNWRGLVCRVRLVGAAGLQVDLRRRASDASTSIADRPKLVGQEGLVSLPVPDDEMEGTAAVVVVYGPDGNVLAQALTIVGR